MHFLDELLVFIWLLFYCEESVCTDVKLKLIVALFSDVGGMHQLAAAVGLITSGQCFFLELSISLYHSYLFYDFGSDV